jgi:thymidylate synthase
MENYREYLLRIKGGFNSPPARENMPKTKVIPTHMLAYHFGSGFPILTGKKMPFYSILAELICFMQGTTDVRAFESLGCGVWWDNAYKWNIKDKGINMPMDEYKEVGMHYYNPKAVNFTYVDHSVLGKISYDLGRIYSAQWTEWTNGLGSSINQLKNLIKRLEDKPYERYAVMTAWNPSEMNSRETSQPNCHVYYQATCVENEYSIEDITDHLNAFLSERVVSKLLEGITNKTPLMFGHLTQRSCDAFLGVPFNITSYALLTIILGIICDIVPMGFVWIGVNNHIYAGHEEAVEKYLNADIYPLPKLDIDIDSMDSLLKIDNINSKEELRSIFRLVGYQSNNKISAKLSVGL